MSGDDRQNSPSISRQNRPSATDKDKFEKHLKEEEAIRTEEQKATLSYLETELEISPIDNPYDYVKELQSRFDNSGIEYSDEYYDVLGIDRK